MEENGKGRKHANDEPVEETKTSETPPEDMAPAEKIQPPPEDMILAEKIQPPPEDMALAEKIQPPPEDMTPAEKIPSSHEDMTPAEKIPFLHKDMTPAEKTSSPPLEELASAEKIQPPPEDMTPADKIPSLPEDMTVAEKTSSLPPEDLASAEKIPPPPEAMAPAERTSPPPPEAMAPADSLHAQDDSATIFVESESEGSCVAQDDIIFVESESEEPVCVEDWMEPLEDDIDDDDDIVVLSGDVSMNDRREAEDLGRAVKEPPCVDWMEPLDFDGSNVTGPGSNIAGPGSNVAGPGSNVAGPGREMNHKMKTSFTDKKWTGCHSYNKTNSLMRQQKKRKIPEEEWEDWPVLGEGWKRKLVVRRSGLSVGHTDAYYMSPQMVRVRSRPELAQVLKKDLSMFRFKTGEFVNAPVRVGWPKKKVKKDLCPAPEVSWMDGGQPRKKKVKRDFCLSPEVTWLDGGEPEHKDPLWNPMSSIKWKRKKEKMMKMTEQTASDEIHNDHNYNINETEQYSWMDEGEHADSPDSHHRVTPVSRVSNLKNLERHSSTGTSNRDPQSSLAPIHTLWRRKKMPLWSIASSLNGNKKKKKKEKEKKEKEKKMEKKKKKKKKKKKMKEKEKEKNDYNGSKIKDDGQEKIKRKRRNLNCGECEACLMKDCGTCQFCVDKKKFGGPDRLKQKCLFRRCMTGTTKAIPVAKVAPQPRGRVRTYSQVQPDSPGEKKITSLLVQPDEVNITWLQPDSSEEKANIKFISGHYSSPNPVAMEAGSEDNRVWVYRYTL